MTEKRFTLTERKCYFTSLIFDNQENEKMGSDEVGELLNALHEENQQYKQALNELKEIGDYQAQRIQELNNENTHIKTTIQTMIKNERTQMGQSVLKQLLEAI